VEESRKRLGVGLVDGMVQRRKDNNNEAMVVEGAGKQRDNKNDVREQRSMRKTKRTCRESSAEPRTKRVRLNSVERTKIRPTLRGLTVGAMEVGNSDARQEVCVWGDAFPSWLLCLDSLGLRARRVMLRSARFLECIKAVVDTDCTIMVVEDVTGCLDLMRAKCQNLELMLVDSGPTSEVVSFARATYVRTIITKRIGQRIPVGWGQTMVVLRHEEVGGVTNSQVRMSRSSTGPGLGTKPMVTKLAPRDASTILDIKGHQVTFMDAPKSVDVEPLAVLNMGAASAMAYYHGGGLLPSSVNRSTRVLTPSLFARPGKWGRRALSLVEVLKAKDLSADDIDRLEEFELTNEFFDALLPVKCLTEGYKALVNGGGEEKVKENEMVFEMTAHSAEKSQLKAISGQASERTSERATGRRKERENGDAEGQRIIKSRSDGETMTEASIVIETVEAYDEVETQCEDDNKTTNQKGETEKPYSLEGIFGGLELDCVAALKIKTEKNGNPSGPTEVMQNESNNQTKVDFAAIDRTRREQKAAKSDEAEVPKYLWLEHLIDDRPTSWPETSQAMLPTALDTFRKYLL
jgi:hypothetical protein